MPYINIKVTDEKVTNEQKKQLIAGATQLLVDVLNKSPEFTHVVIDEVPIDNWGVKASQYSELLNQKNQTAIITGASTRIGRAIAKYFLEKGMNLVLNSSNSSRLLESYEALGPPSLPFKFPEILQSLAPEKNWLKLP